MSQRCKCVGVIDQMGSPLLVYSLAHLSFNQWVLGSIPGWVTKNCKFIWHGYNVCLVIVTSKVVGGGDVQSLTVHKLWLYLVTQALMLQNKVKIMNQILNKFAYLQIYARVDNLYIIPYIIQPKSCCNFNMVEYEWSLLSKTESSKSAVRRC